MAIKNVRLPAQAGGGNFNLEEWLHWPLFSAIEAQAGVAVDLRAFSYVVGQNVPQAGAISTGARSATESDTNQVARSRINHDEAFVAFSMTFEHWALEGTTNSDSVYNVPPLDDAAVAPILRGTNLHILQQQLMMELFVGANISKPMASAPFEYYGQGIGAPAWGSGDALTIANGGATALNLNYGTGGAISPENQRRWHLPVQIDPDRVMYVRLRSPGGALTGIDQDWRLKVYLDGLKRRPVA
jgi:hypothetical protein